MDIALFIKFLCLGDIAYRMSQFLRPIPPVENTDDGGHLDGIYGQEPKTKVKKGSTSPRPNKKS